jgi:hypothetical protein
MAGRLGKIALVGRLAFRQIAQGGLRRGDLAVLEQHAHALPDDGGREALLLHRRLDEAQAAVGQLFRLEPDRRIDAAERGLVAARQAGEPAIAADLQVLARVERRLALERRPVAPLAEHAQPVAAQHLAHVGVAMLLQECLHLGRRPILQAHGQLPVVHPGLEHVLVQVLRVPRELHRIAGAIGVVGPQQLLVGLHRAEGRRSGDQQD